MIRRSFLGVLPAAAAVAAPKSVPDKLVVLCFDDAVKSHRHFVAPLVAGLGFRATFFATHRWMDDRENFMTWGEIGEIHRMGFEIGNHTWTHGDFSIPRAAARLAGELALVESELKKAGVPKPVSFAYPGNFFGPEAVAVLDRAGYRFARRGAMPEVEYGKAVAGPAFDRLRHHRLLIPTTGDGYPNWTLNHFRDLVSRARDGAIVVLQFHGVPDVAHPWVHTPPDMFRRYMQHLKENGYRTMALGDLDEFVDDQPVADPRLSERYRPPKDGRLRLPPEMEATHADLPFWLANMARHGYSSAEMSVVTGGFTRAAQPESATARLLPYPGGRHPRIGFLEGAIDPLRGTKASVFLPWESGGYAVVDLPEAVFSSDGLLFLAHTHVPTVWDERNQVIENADWERLADGGLRSHWLLPNGVAIGAAISLEKGEAAMELWITNATAEPLRKLRAQICVLLKGAPGFGARTNDNKTLRSPLAAVRSASEDRWIATEWENCGRVWANPACPCLHSDPWLPDCQPGETVRVRGRLWFHEGPAPAA